MTTFKLSFLLAATEEMSHFDLFPKSHLKPPLHHTALNNIYISQVNGRLKKQMYLIKICIIKE